VSEKLGKPPELYLEYYSDASSLHDQPDMHDKDSSSTPTEMDVPTQNEGRNSMKRSRKEKSKFIVEPFYRLHNSRLKILNATPFPTEESPLQTIQYLNQTYDLLEKYNFVAPRPFQSSQQTNNQRSLSERREHILKNIVEALQYATYKFNDPHKVLYKLAWIHKFTEIRNLKKARSEIKKVIFPDEKEFIPKLWIENIFSFDKRRGSLYFDYGKEELYMKRYIRLYVEICHELNDMKSLETVLEEVPRLKRTQQYTYAQQLDHMFVNYLQLVNERLRKQKIDDSDDEKMSNEDDDDAELLKKVYTAYLRRGLFQGENMDTITALLRRTYRRSTKEDVGEREGESSNEDGSNLSIDVVLAYCKKQWPKLHEKHPKKKNVDIVGKINK